MKVLLINSVCGIGSTGRICTDIAQRLEQAGHEVKIAYGRGHVPEAFRKYALRIGSTADVLLHGAKARMLDAMGFGSRRATQAFIRWVREYDPDVIHLHNVHGYYINIDVLFSFLKTYEKKVIWTLHDCWAFTGHCAHFLVEGCDRWKSGCHKCRVRNVYPKRIFTLGSHTNFEKKRSLFTGIRDLTIVTPSHWLAQLVGQSFLKEYPVRVIHNGVDLNAFLPMDSDLRQKYGIHQRYVVLGVASTWTQRKGLQDMCRLPQLLGQDYKVVLMGVSPQQKKTLPKEILGIERTYSLRELAQWYSAANVFVNPTQEENFCLVNLEAMACGTPVVTYDAGGCRETISGVGVCVPVGALEQMADAVRRFCAGAESCGQACLDNVGQFDKARMLDAYEGLFE